MSDIAVRVENLSKQYRIGGPQAPYKTIRESLTEAVQAPFRRLSSVVRGQSSVVSKETIWALKDVSFEVKRGEVVGIIGRNGSGKTTLLKILSRITEPTEGYAQIHGRVGSLLEVGTGFHPELTGRENITLNGAILGMKRAEIDRKFDEIVDFAEIERFIDTPVKHYSSGMYVRLAFAVAAHLEPEILLVDEVLAVGDAAFQKKCLGKMGEVAKEGRTVLFVSHNMATVSSLCPTAYLLEQGRIAASGPSQQVIDEYIQSLDTLTTSSLRSRKDRKGDGRLRFTEIAVVDADGTPVENVRSGEDIALLLSYEIPDGKPRTNVSVGISFYGTFGEHLFTCWTAMLNSNYQQLLPGEEITCEIARLPLSAGRYSFNIYCEVNGVLADWLLQAGTLSVIEGDYFGTGRLPPQSHGGLLVDHQWKRRRNTD